MADIHVLPTEVPVIQGQQFRKFFRLTKVDEGAHTVFGLATSEAVDCQDEICDYGGAKESFSEWSKDFLSRTTGAGQDPSLGCIRIQHSLEIGGKVTRLEFRDETKEVWLETSPVNEDIWNMLKGGFLTGYSIGGKVTKVKKEGKYTRYWPEISEVSYVDNPANPEATYAYIKSDGSTELRKFKSKLSLEEIGANARQKTTEFSSVIDRGIQEGQPVSTLLNPLFSPDQLAMLQTTMPGLFKAADGKTKRVAGEDLPSSAFAYVGDKDDTSTWKLPIHFSSDDKSKRHVRNALARFDQTQGIPEPEKEAVHAKILAAAKKYGIDAADEAKKAAAAEALLKSYLTNACKDKEQIKKSLYDVGTLASIIMTLSYIHQSCLWEAEYENDDRDEALAVEVAAAVQHLTEIMLEMASEDASELPANRAMKSTPAHEAAINEEGATEMEDELLDIAKELADLAKAGHTGKANFTKMASDHAKLSAKHAAIAALHEKAAGSHESMGGLHKDMMEAHKAAAASPDSNFHKGGMAHQKEKAAQQTGLHKAHMAISDCHKSMSEHCKAMAANGPEDEKEKAMKAAELIKADELAAAELAKAAADKAAAEAAAAPVVPPVVPAPASTDPAQVMVAAMQKTMDEMKTSFEASLAKAVADFKSPAGVEAPAPTPGGTPLQAGPVLVPRPGVSITKAAQDDKGI